MTEGSQTPRTDARALGADEAPRDMAPLQAMTDLAETLERELAEARSVIAKANAGEDQAYLERAYVVAALARLYPSGTRKTDIPGWKPNWHGCVYIDLPAGQISFHYEDSQAPLFAALPPYTKPYDEHSKADVFMRLGLLDCSYAERCSVVAELVWQWGDMMNDGPDDSDVALANEWLVGAFTLARTLRRERGAALASKAECNAVLKINDAGAAAPRNEALLADTQARPGVAPDMGGPSAEASGVTNSVEPLTVSRVARAEAHLAAMCGWFDLMAEKIGWTAHNAGAAFDSYHASRSFLQEPSEDIARVEQKHAFTPTALSRLDKLGRFYAVPILSDAQERELETWLRQRGMQFTIPAREVVSPEEKRHEG